ncbi:MAG: peptidylprolyl isomerase [Gemmatimonadales bacterium]|nr:peptidylprolyl isomerase [Gemmatimonadales bacterium]MYG18974.1 peptidylprolyl isomerase [Gemmatimonadales bacterium]
MPARAAAPFFPALLRSVPLVALVLTGCRGIERVPSSGSAEDEHQQAGSAVAAVAVSPVEVAVETSQGEFVIAVHRDWAPLGAERFLTLVESGYYDDARFHRVVPDFIVQWGLAGDPAITAQWMNAYIPDDPVVASNTRGRIAFAFTDPGTRATQVYINLVDSVRLDSTGFAPFGEVVSGMEVVDALYSGYGENSGGGLRRGDQSRIVAEGNTYLDREYPLLDRLLRALRG